MKAFFLVSLLLPLALAGVAQNEFVKEEHRVVTSERGDGRYLSTYGVVHTMLKNTQPKLSFNADFTPEEFRSWQREVSAAMTDLMNHPSDSGLPEPTLLWSEHRDGYTESKWEFYPLPECVSTFLVLTPDSISEAVPAVLCIPGSGVAKEQLTGDTPAGAPNTAFARSIARCGYITVAVDNAAAGEAADLEPLTGVGYDYDTPARILLELGWSWLGYTSYLDKVVLNWMKRQPSIRRDRIVVCGFSLGTEPLMALGAMDSTIYAFIYNDFLCNTKERATVVTMPDDRGRRNFPNSIRHLIPRWWQYFNFPDVVASLAPRPIILTEGGLDRDFRIVERAYELSGHPEAVELHHYEKFANESERTDVEELDEGLSMNEYLRAANVDAQNHYFKEEYVLPWLNRILRE